MNQFKENELKSKYSVSGGINIIISIYMLVMIRLIYIALHGATMQVGIKLESRVTAYP